MWIGVLGPLQVRHEEQPRPLPDGKQRSVLAALALSANRSVSLDELADLVWDGHPPAAADATLRNYVSRLRHALGPGAADRLGTGRFGYLMHLADEELDAAQLDACHRAGQAAARAGDWSTAGTVLTRGLELWRGNPLADIPSQALQHEHGQRLAHVRLHLLELRIEADLRLGRYDQLAFELEDLTRRHPMHERFHAQLVLVLARCGRQAEALAVFRRARRLLVQELGIEPGPELRRAHEQVLAGDFAAEPESAPPITAGAAAVPEPPAQLPSDLPDFTGRSDLVQRLCDALRGTAASPGGPEAALVQTVSGAGGTGKTVLAVHVAHRLAEHFPDGQLYVDLTGSAPDPQPPGEVLARLLRDLGLPPEAVPADLQERAARYRSLLARRRVLVVLDDARDAAQIRLLLPGAGSSRVLVTGRTRMTGLDAAGQVGLGPLDAAEARALFGRITGPARTDAEPQATEEVLRACAGLPLAVRIAAGLLGARAQWGIRELADRLADERHRLDRLAVGDLAVRTSFDTGYARLPQPAGDDGVAPARCLRLLGCTTGPDIGVPAVAALTGAREDQAEAALDALVDANLLHADGQGRYRLDGLSRAYALERADAEETPAARTVASRSLLSWYLRTAVAADRCWSTTRRGLPTQLPDIPDTSAETPAGTTAASAAAFGGSRQAEAWLAGERPNLVAAVHQAAQLGHHDIAWQLPLAVADFLALHDGLAESVDLCEVARTSARRTGEPEAEAYVLTHLVTVYQRADRCHEALFHGRRALGIWQALGDRWMRAEVLLGCGGAHRDLGRFTEAVRDFTEVLAFYRDRDHAAGQCAALLGLGTAYRRAGLLTESVAALDQCLAITRETGDHRTEGDALAELAQAHRRLGEPQRAVDLLVRAIAAAQQTGGGAEAGTALLALAQTLRDVGRPEDARARLVRAEALLAELGDPRAAQVRAELDRDA